MTLATAQLRVKTLDGEAITLRVQPTDTVASVKGKIQAFEGAGPVPATSQLGSRLEGHNSVTRNDITQPLAAACVDTIGSPSDVITRRVCMVRS